MEQQIPAGWQVKKICDICDVYQPRTISGKEMQNGGDFPVFGANGLIGHYTRYNHEEPEVLLGCRGSCGVINFSSPFSWVNGNAMVIHPKTAELSKKFLKYYLENCNFSEYTSGVATPQITRKSLSPLRIKYPSLSEQKRIVKKLDDITYKIDCIKANTEFELSAVKDLFENTLEKLCIKDNKKFPCVFLSSVCSITSSLVNPQLPEHIKKFHIGGANIESNSGKIIGLKTAEDEKLVSGKFVFDSSMILYNKIRPYLRKVARPDYEGLCSADMYPLKPNQNIDRNFLFYLLLSADFTHYAEIGSSRAGMPKVNRTHLFNYSFSLPPIVQQKEISQTLDKLKEKIDSYKSTVHIKLNLLEELKQSILKQAFAGEL